MTTFRSFKQVQSALSNQLTTCVEITNSYLQKIEEHNHLNAFVEVYTDEALSQALAVDKKLESGNAGKLAGMVIGIKDNLCYKGHKVSASSKILDGFESLFSATVIDKVFKTHIKSSIFLYITHKVINTKTIIFY